VRDRGKLHIAKFPWVRDEWPVIQWEAALLELASAAGVTTPPARLERVGTKPVLLMDRFDREGGDVRVPFMSAMTALDAKDHSEDRSYLEVLDVIRQFGAFPKEDARELWRRMAFNVLVSNTDDHLRNHGFLWAGEGWRLAPAYDMNPSPPHINPRIHVLALNELDHTSSIDTVMSVSKDFGLALADAKAIAGEVATAVSSWKTAAAKARLSKDDIAFMADAFEHDDLRTALGFGSAIAPPRSGGAKGRKGAVSPGGAKATKRATTKKATPRKRSATGGK
jgi:serine/threonine-protein kinase HipA